ncbi:MAG: YkgJ family cysteine cluster protein [Candidatus Gastranaerophilales bacterium]|nr:YkgJ family cysteine cluster protein [Candidatus Gastranaerophilales bacterium]
MLIKYLKVLYYEFLSNFVIQKVRYKVTGECKKCGKCCNYMYSKDTYTEKEFKIMQFLYPAYKRFEVRGWDEDGNIIIGCKLVNKDGTCSVYNKRLRMCRRYPEKIIYFRGELHEGCGYKIEPEKSFEDYLN